MSKFREKLNKIDPVYFDKPAAGRSGYLSRQPTLSDYGKTEKTDQNMNTELIYFRALVELSNQQIWQR